MKKLTLTKETIRNLSTREGENAARDVTHSPACQFSNGCVTIAWNC
jgi:hypothetical protein